MTKSYFTSESVTEGHPDKICDQVSDAILDDLLRQDPYSRVAVESLTTTGTVHVAGEVTMNVYLDKQFPAKLFTLSINCKQATVHYPQNAPEGSASTSARRSLNSLLGSRSQYRSQREFRSAQ